MKKKRIVVVCPGRGSYTKETLGYLKKYGAHVKDFIADVNERRRSLSEPTITELDSADSFKPNLHTKGEHASSLIYACAYADFMAIDRENYEVVAITGNSMGWYLTLAFAGSLDWAGGFEVVNTMGSMMKEGTVGGQIIYPICDEHWVISPKKRELVEKAIAEIGARDGHEAHISIELGGYLVLGGNKPAMAALLKELPKIEDYPFQLINHAAFHTPILSPTSARALEVIPLNLFNAPKIPMVDGRGAIWQPYSSSIQELYQYTLGHQVVQVYDFTRAISVSLKEFAPDHLVLLGPGGSLGGSIGQIMIENNWKGLKSKEDFMKAQAESRLLISMGRDDQRQIITK
jgi:acyl transferase domain-containing protein